MYHLARALDKMLLQGGVGGLAAWIEEKPPCRMLSPTEYRYEAKDLAPFEDHDAEVWQRWCVEDAATNNRRFEVPASRGDHIRPLIVVRVFCTGVTIAGTHLRSTFKNVVFQ